jgi:hypothetical protein
MNISVHGPLALADRGQVHRHRANAHPVLRAAAGLVGEARAGEHRLGRSASRIDAHAAELATLDERHFMASFRQLGGEEAAALAGPDHDRVVVLIGHCAFCPSAFGMRRQHANATDNSIFAATATVGLSSRNA